MDIIKNLLETRSGKIIAAITGSSIIVIIIFIVSIVIFSNVEDDEESQGELEEVIELDDTIAGEILYSGVWYSNRPDQAVLTLSKDGSYTSTAWIFNGHFLIEDKQIILEESGRGTIMLELHTIRGETVLYDPENGYYFYSSQEQLENAISIQQGFNVLEADVEEQKWLDILKQGVWTYANDGFQYSMTFSDYYIEIESIFEEELSKATFEYYIEAIDIHEDHAVDISFRRKRQEVEKVFLPAIFRIRETDTKYVITAQVGTFIWNNTFEKPITEVELTQNGVTEAQRSELQSISIDEDGNRVIVRERVIE